MSRSFVSISDDQIKKAETLLQGVPGGAKRALSRSLNRATIAGQTAAIKNLRDGYHVKAGDIRSTIRISKASPSRLSAEINSKGSAIRLIKFKVNPQTVNAKRRTPVRVGVAKGGQSVIKAGFIARMPNGTKGVFERTGKFKTARAGRYAGRKREMIEQKFGPSVPQMLGNKTIVKEISERATEMLDKRLDHEINRILGGGQ